MSKLDLDVTKPVSLILADGVKVRRIPLGILTKDTFCDFRNTTPEDVAPTTTVEYRASTNVFIPMLIVGAIVGHYGGFWAIIAISTLWYFGSGWKR